jgi:hypothetical protein
MSIRPRRSVTDPSASIQISPFHHFRHFVFLLPAVAQNSLAPHFSTIRSSNTSRATMTTYHQSKPDNEVESMHSCYLHSLRQDLQLQSSAPIRPVDLLSTTCVLLDGNGLPRPSRGRLTRRELGDLLDEALAIGSDLFTVDETTSEGPASN